MIPAQATWENVISILNEAIYKPESPCTENAIAREILGSSLEAKAINQNPKKAPIPLTPIKSPIIDCG